MSYTMPKKKRQSNRCGMNAARVSEHTIVNLLEEEATIVCDHRCFK